MWSREWQSLTEIESGRITAEPPQQDSQLDRYLQAQRVRRPYLLRLISDSFVLIDQLATGKCADIYEIRRRSERLARKLKSALNQEARFEASRQKS